VPKRRKKSLREEVTDIFLNEEYAFQQLEAGLGKDFEQHSSRIFHVHRKKQDDRNKKSPRVSYYSGARMSQR